MAHTPYADKEKHSSEIKISVYYLYVVAVKNQEEAVAVSKSYLAEKHIESIMLCLGFSHTDVAEIVAANQCGIEK
jgi:hypothetical protein